ncbi:hypothetical protein D3C78_1531110 [compost metagenome]
MLQHLFYCAYVCNTIFLCSFMGFFWQQISKGVNLNNIAIAQIVQVCRTDIAAPNNSYFHFCHSHHSQEAILM